MKTFAVTALVLALGLAACQDNAPDDPNSTANTIETEAEADLNAATNESVDAANAADNALDAAGNAVENAGESIENAAEAVENSTTN